MFLKNKNIIFKIRRSKVTDYAALNVCKISVKKVNSETIILVPLPRGFSMLIKD